MLQEHQTDDNCQPNTLPPGQEAIGLRYPLK